MVTRYTKSDKYPGLTVKQADVLDLVIEFYLVADLAPAAKEIADGLGKARMTGGQHNALHKCMMLGYIVRNRNGRYVPTFSWENEGKSRIYHIA